MSQEQEDDKWEEVRRLAEALGRPWQQLFMIDAMASQARLRATLEEKRESNFTGS